MDVVLCEAQRLCEADNPETFWQKPGSTEWWQALLPRLNNEQAVRDWMFQRLERADREPHASLFGGPNGPEINRKIADVMPLYRTRQGIMIGNRPKVSRARQPMIGTESPEGSAPEVDWHHQDLQDRSRYVTSETIKRDYVVEKDRNRVTVYSAYVPSSDIPDEICAEEHCDDDDDDGGGGYDWEQFRFRGAFPPAKLEVKRSGEIVIVDGNHRIRWWRQNDYDDIPAWVIDYRRVKPRVEA